MLDWFHEHTYTCQLLISVNGGLSNWTISNDTDCFETDHNGYWEKPKFRTCSNPVPSLGGVDCEGNMTGYHVCLPSK
jgi:hypothetical protein